MAQKQGESLSTYVLAVAFFIFIIGLLIGAGYLAYTKVDWSFIQPTPTPAQNTVLHEQLAVDIERAVDYTVDVVDLRWQGDYHVSAAIVPVDEMTDAQFVTVDRLLAEAAPSVRVVGVQMVEQLGHEVYATAYAFDCRRNIDPETMNDIPLACARDKGVPSGLVIQSEGLQYVGFQ